MSVAVHALVWLAGDRRGTANELGSSQQIASSVNTNPVVIRRLLGELREAGLVRATRGRGGGWSLVRAATDITLADVRRALGESGLFGMHPGTPNPECYVGLGIQPVLGRVYHKVELAVDDELSRITLADVLQQTTASSEARRLA